MKNFFKLFGIVALVAAIGFTMVACGDSEDSYNFVGTWTAEGGFRLVARGDNTFSLFMAEFEAFSLFMAEFEAFRGTFTQSGNNVTATITQVQQATWVDWNEEIAASAEVAAMGITQVMNFNIAGNRFAIGEGNFTKQ